MEYDFKKAIYDSSYASEMAAQREFALARRVAEARAEVARAVSTSASGTDWMPPDQADLMKAISSVRNESRIASIMGTLIDPRAVSHDHSGARKKPTLMDFNILRRLSYACEPIRVAIEYRKTQIRMAKWRVCLADEDEEATDQQEAQMKEIERLLKRKNRNKDSLSRTLEKATEDLLALDAGCVQVVPSRAGKYGEMVAMDGATIRPKVTKKGILDPKTPYIQWIENQITGKFRALGLPGMTQGTLDKPAMIYMMQNPVTNIFMNGYGVSPIEMLITAVTALVHGSRYNADYFYGPKVPEGLLYLGSAATQKDVTYFRYFWEHELSQGWAIPVVGGGYRPDHTHAPTPPQFIPFHRSPKEMQFHEYIQWLTRLVCAAFQIPVEEIGLAQRSYGPGQSGPMFEANKEPTLDTSRDWGLKPLLQLIAYEITEVVQHFWGDEYRFDFVLPHVKDNAKEATRVEVLTKAGLFHEDARQLFLENQKREIAGLDPLSEDQWKQIQEAREKAQKEAQEQQIAMQQQMAGPGATPGANGEGGEGKEGPSGVPRVAGASGVDRPDTTPQRPSRRPATSTEDEEKKKREREKKRSAIVKPRPIVAKALGLPGGGLIHDLSRDDFFDDQETEDLAREWESEIRRILMNMVEDLGDLLGVGRSIDLGPLAKALDPPTGGMLAGELPWDEVEKIMDRHLNGIWMTVQDKAYVDAVTAGAIREPSAIYTPLLAPVSLPKSFNFPTRAYMVGQKIAATVLMGQGLFSGGARTLVRPEEIDWLRQHTFWLIKGQTQKVKNQIQRVMMEERHKGTHPFQIKTKMTDMIGDFMTDYRRITRTETSRSQTQAFYKELLAAGEEECTFLPHAGACRHCQRLIEGRVFRIKDIMHVTNFNKRVDEWEPCCPLHPNCKHRPSPVVSGRLSLTEREPGKELKEDYNVAVRELEEALAASGAKVPF